MFKSALCAALTAALILPACSQI